MITALTHGVRCLPKMVLVRFGSIIHFRGVLVLQTILVVCRNVIAISIWGGVARASGGTVDGYATGDFVAYFLVLLLVREFTFSGLEDGIASEVRRGRIAIRLLRPVHPLFHYFAEVWAYRLIAVVVLAPSIVLLWIAFGGSTSTDPPLVAAGLLVLAIAIATRFFADAIIGAISLRLVRTEGINNAYRIVLLFAGGQFAPLEVLPTWLERGAKLLPFYWTMGYPTELLIGRADLADVPRGIGVLAIWGVVLYFLFQRVWRSGLRAHESVGQ